MNFQLIADDLVFEVPWTHPDLFRLKLWHKQIWTPWPCRIGLKPYLYGDFWSSGAESANSLSIWLETIVPWSAMTAADWRELRNHMRTAFQLALDRYRLLVILSVGEPHSAQRLGELVLQAEVEQSTAHLIREQVPARLDLIARLQMFRDGIAAGELAIESEAESESMVTNGNEAGPDWGGWHRHSHRYLETIGAWAARGRVYYRPVLLTELLDW